MKKKKSKKHSKKPIQLSQMQKRLLKKKDLICDIGDVFIDIQLEMVDDSMDDAIDLALKELIKQEIEGISNEDDIAQLEKEITYNFNLELRGGLYYDIRQDHHEFLIEHDKSANKTEAIIKLLNKISDDD